VLFLCNTSEETKITRSNGKMKATILINRKQLQKMSWVNLNAVSCCNVHAIDKKVDFYFLSRVIWIYLFLYIVFHHNPDDTTIVVMTHQYLCILQNSCHCLLFPIRLLATFWMILLQPQFYIYLMGWDQGWVMAFPLVSSLFWGVKIWQAIPKFFLFFGENFLLLV